MKLFQFNRYAGLFLYIGLSFLILFWIFSELGDTLLSYIFVAGGVLLILLWSFLARNRIFSKLKKRTSQKAMSSLLILFVVLGVLTALYYLAKKYPKRVDWTQDQIFSLSEQSKKVLKELNYPIRITVLSTEDLVEGIDSQNSLPTLLRFYEQEDAELSLRYLNPRAYPHLFQLYQFPSQQEGVGTIGILIQKMLLPKTLSAEFFEKEILDRLKQQESLNLLKQAYIQKASEYVLQEGVQEDQERRNSIADQLERVGYSFSEYTTLLVSDLYSGRQYQGEAKITSKIVSLEQRQKQILHVSRGHGEKSFENEYQSLKVILELEGYEIQPLDLTKDLSSETVELLLVAGPTRPFLGVEIENLRTYLKEGGRALILWDPIIEYAPAGSRIDVGLLDILAEYQIQTDDSFVFDPPNIRNVPLSVQQGIALLQIHIGEYGSHPIVQPLKEAEIPTYFLGLRPFFIGEPEGLKLLPILKSGAKSWADRDGESDQIENSLNPETDRKGPLILGIAVQSTDELGSKSGLEEEKSEEKSEQSKIPSQKWILIGDSDFVFDPFTPYGKDLFMNSISWLNEKEGEISIRPKERKNRQLNLNFNRSRVLFFIGVLILPFSILGIGLGVYIRRRRNN